MNVIGNGTNWVICLDVDKNIVEEITSIIKNNINSFIKDKKTNISTKGKNSNQYWLIDRSEDFFFDDLNFRNFIRKYKKIISNALIKSNLIENNVGIRDFKNCWYVEGYGNDFFHTAHCHNGGEIDGISTVLYLDVPEKREYVRGQSGEIFLILESGPNNKFYKKDKVLEVYPKKGKLLIFPDWIIHGTYPQNTSKNEVRQSFNIDFTLDLNFPNVKNINYF